MLSRNQTILMVVIFAARAVHMVTVLSPPVVDVIEHSNVTLTCRVMNPSGQINQTAWKKNETGSYFGYIINVNGTCSAIGHLNNVSLYAWSCERNSTFTLTLKDVKRNEHKKEWLCQVFFILSDASQILVRVPVESVRMNSHTKEIISTQENRSTTFECTTTSSRPIPAIFWFLRNPEHLQILNVTNNARQTPQAGESINFATVTSVLNYNFTRRVNGWSLYCQAANMPDQYVTSGQKLLDIMYPPDGDPKMIGTENDPMYRSVEHQVGKLTCTINGGNPLANITWSCFEGNVSESSTNDSISSTLAWTVLRMQQNESCTCVAEHAFGKSNVSMVINVMYPPNKPTITVDSQIVVDNFKIIVNNTLHFTCLSKSNPESEYTWTGSLSFLKKGQSMRIERIQEKDKGDYTCTANNTMVGSDGYTQDGNNSSSITIHILFPPRIPKFYFVYNKTTSWINDISVDVIKGDTFTLLCQSEGRPSPEYIWENRSNGTMSVIVAGQSMNKTCTANNNMTETVGESQKGSSSANVSITVFYSPKTPKMYIYNQTGIKNHIQEHVIVIENESFYLKCISDGNPNPQYKWFVNNSEISSDHQELMKTNISRQQSGIYKCQAYNIMIRTFGERQHGTRNASIPIDVLYPAEVDNLTETVAIEGNSINVTCPIIPGNPSVANVTWKPGGDLGNSFSRDLYISNISRADEKKYVCQVTTIMKPTYGPPRTQLNKREFQLTVVYKASVTKFYIEKETSNNVFTVNETNDVPILCYIDSKPSSNATLYNNVGIIRISGNNNLTYTMKNIQCTDSGLYTCSGNNYYNYGTPSKRSLTLYVNCTPRPSPFVTLNKDVKCARNMPATLSFTALAYPEPGFTWNYINGSDAIPLSDNSNTVISSSNLQSNLTIKNVSQADYGQYVLSITNSIGVHNQTFDIGPYDVPMPPRILSWAARETAITITIKAGLDGGLPQSFYIKYKRTTRENWIKDSIFNETISDVFNHTVSGLYSGTTYDVMIYATNTLGNSIEETIVVETKEFFAIPSKVKNTGNIGPIIGTVTGVAIVIIVIAVVGIFLYRKRANDDTGKLIYQNVPFTGKMLKKKNEKRKTDETPMEDLQEIDDVQAFEHEPTEYYNSADKLDMIDRLKVSELFSYILANDEDSFGTAYQKLPTGLEKPCTFARKMENIALNRYNGIYPYDHSRVKIQGHPDFFINACYIDGYRRPKSYIASLGPTGKTTNGFETFWQMVWHEKTDIIVMLTNLQEPSGMKCERYWPKEGASEQYGDVCVSIQKLEVFAEYIVKTLKISKEDVYRTVTHLHYTAWPDKKVPEDATSLLEFRQRIKSTKTSSEGPIIVHCSAGIGRTGTLIALDRLIEEGYCEGSVNVSDCVNSMREQRVKMVQTLEQYIYIYKALVNAFDLDCETIHVDSFKEYVGTTKNNVYSRQFQHIKQSLEIEGKEDLEASTGNERITKKNRIEADIPARRFQVLLYTNEAGEDSEYINAVYMHSFKRKEYFIIAQSPLPNTVEDFICMIYQEDCTCIVTMEDLAEPGMAVGVYLPSDKHTLKFDNLTVYCTVLETNHHCIVRKVKIKNGSGEKSLYHFQYTKWMTGHDTPANPKDFVQFVIEVEEYASQFLEERSHVLVHCLKANERSGLFCAVTTLLEKLKYERQVSVLNTLKHLRTRRRSIITSMEQLKFCYQAASVYIQMYNP